MISIYHCPSVNWAIHLAPFFGLKAPANGGLAANSCLISFIMDSSFGPAWIPQYQIREDTYIVPFKQPYTLMIVPNNVMLSSCVE